MISVISFDTGLKDTSGLFTFTDLNNVDESTLANAKVNILLKTIPY